VGPTNLVLLEHLTYSVWLMVMVAAMAAVAALVVCERSVVDRSGFLLILAAAAFIAVASMTWLSGLIGEAFEGGAIWASKVVPGPGLLSAAGALHLLSDLLFAAAAIGFGAMVARKLAKYRARRAQAAVAEVFRRHRAQQIGAAGEGLVACELAGLGWPTLRNVILGDSGRTVEIDILLRVSDGIVALEVKSWGGFIAGTDVATYWTQYISGGETKLLNPAVQNLAHVRALERFVGDPALSVRGFVVSAGRAQFSDGIAHIPVPVAALRGVLGQHVQVALMDQGRIDAAWRRLVHEAHQSDARRSVHGAYVARRQSGRRGRAAAE